MKCSLKMNVWRPHINKPEIWSTWRVSTFVRMKKWGKWGFRKCEESEDFVNFRKVRILKMRRKWGFASKMRGKWGSDPPVKVSNNSTQQFCDYDVRKWSSLQLGNLPQMWFTTNQCDSDRNPDSVSRSSPKCNGLFLGPKHTSGNSVIWNPFFTCK